MILSRMELRRYLDKSVEDLLLHPVQLDQASQKALLNEVDAVSLMKIMTCLSLPLLSKKSLKHLNPLTSMQLLGLMG